MRWQTPGRASNGKPRRPSDGSLVAFNQPPGEFAADAANWIDVGIAGLVVLAVQGPLLAERTARKVENALHENGYDPTPGPLIAEFSNFGVVLGIV